MSNPAHLRDQPSRVDNRVIWLVPTHLPRFGVYRAMSKSLKRFSEGIESAVILSFHSEVKSFWEAGCFADILIVLEDHFTTDEIRDFIHQRSIINVKKIFALKVLFAQQNVSRVVVSDDEVELVQKIDRASILAYETKYNLHRVAHPYLMQIVGAPLLLMANQHERSVAQDYFVEESYFGWFSDLPIYEREHIQSFFRRYDLEGLAGFSKITFESFDWVMYSYSKFLDLGGATFNKLAWPATRHSASWFEMGYHNRLGRTLLGDFYTTQGSLWVPDAVLLKSNPNAVAVFNTDRDYRDLRKIIALPKGIYRACRKLVGKVMGR